MLKLLVWPLFAFVLFAAGSAQAGITVTRPFDGASTLADPCPVAPCRGGFQWEIEITGAPADMIAVEFIRTSDGADRTHYICTPPDPIEGNPGCPDLPLDVDREIRLSEGVWDAVVRVTRGASVEESTPIRVTVFPPNLTPAGTIALSRVEPNAGSPPFLLRDPGLDHPDGIYSEATEVQIIGENLHNNPFLDVHIAPKLFGEPVLTADSGLPVDDWCRTEVEIVGQGELPSGESSITVKMPALPLEMPTRCGFSPGPSGSIFSKNWRWAIRDRWIRPERVHTWWAIPSQRDVPWLNAPPFKVVKPTYPKIDGFGFRNHSTDASYKEFLTVYGNNAYLCVGAFGVCLTRIPDPLYHLLWLPIYKKAVNSTGGSCNGMSATSLLMANEDLQPEDFESAVHFPAGFDDPGMPNRMAMDSNGNPFIEGIATYRDSNFCTPFCSPPKAKNLWANIRKNHGVQISREFLFELLETVGTAILDPGDGELFQGIPNATLERVRSNPRGYVLCFFQPGNGHCVTPYSVAGNRIWIYDNNAPNDDSRYIDIVDGDYDYPKRRDVDDAEPNQGNAIVAFPINMWKSGRHLLGLKDLALLVGGVDFIYLIAVGDAGMNVTDDNGGRWGFEDDGSFSDTLPGSLSIALLGPNEQTVRQMPLLVAMNQEPPSVEINADGGQYFFHVAQGGSLLQLESSSAQDGDMDRVQVGYRDGRLGGFDFAPQRDAARVVARLGLEIDEEESGVFQVLGLQIPGGRSVGFDSDPEARAVGFRNDTGAPTQHVLALDYGSGETEGFGRMIFGPFEVPEGATQRVVAMDWPDVGHVLHELDFDRDGTVDFSEVVEGREAPAPLAPGLEADLSIEKSVAPETLALGETATYIVVVENLGPEDAHEVALVDVISGAPYVELVDTTHGSCSPQPDGISCELGTLDAGEVATIVYTAAPSLPGSMANGASVFGVEGDPDLTNNTAVTTTQVPIVVDIKPGNGSNTLNPTSAGVIPVAILGSEGFDVKSIDVDSLAFGPGGAPHERGSNVQYKDVNGDGHPDLVSHYRTALTAIAHGDTRACISASTLGGRALAGCDSLRTVPRKGRKGR